MSRLIGRIVDWLSGRDAPKFAWDLETPLIDWTRGEPWTIGNSVEGTLILGATGSGKTSGSGATLAKSFLAAGYGGTVLTAKGDERATWERYCAETNRSDDLIVIGPDCTRRFNFLAHEQLRGGAGAGQTENIVDRLTTIVDIAERRSSGGGQNAEQYWKRASRQLLRNAVELMLLARRPVSVPDLYTIVLSAPKSRDQMRSEDWRARSVCCTYLREAERAAASSRAHADYQVVLDYFTVEFPSLAEKTRSVIVSSFTSTIDVLNRGLLRDVFCADTNVSPEVVEQGKIVLVDFPVKEFGEVGVFAQTLWKDAFQHQVERRNVLENPRPVFLWADEAQNFLTSYDQQFQTTCRASRVATVLLSQNSSNFYVALGGTEKGKDEAASLFANLNTKIFHANADPVTNEWAATVVGKSLQVFANGSTSSSEDGSGVSALGFDWLNRSQSASAGFSESYDFDLQPSRFTKLRTGGPANGWIVDAIVVQSGRLFRSNKKCWIAVSFAQRTGKKGKVSQ